MTSLPVKVYRNNEIRRFHMETGEKHRFGFQRLVNKIKHLFPDLDNNRVRFLWKDNDGEFVVMSSGQELMEAVRNLPAENPVLRVHVMDVGDVDYAKQEKQQEEDEQKENLEKQGPQTHPCVVCDSCEDKIRGIRYKCLTCPDFDLCSTCLETSPHDEHPMIRIASPADNTWKPAFMATQDPNPSVKASQNQTPRYQPPASAFGPAPPPHPFGPVPMHPLHPFFVHPGHRFGPPGHIRCHRGPPPCRWAGRFEAKGQEEKKPEQSATQEAKKPEQNATQEEKPEAKQPELFREDLIRSLSEAIESVLDLVGIPIQPPASDAVPPTQPKTGTAETTKETPETNTGLPADAATASASAPVHPDPKIAAGLYYMHAMGYKNEGGWLTKLLEEKRGDVPAVLDILHPNAGR